MSLEDLRKKVDDIDTQILKFLNQRANLTLKIGRLKAKKGVDVYVPNRERKIYERLMRQNKGPLSNEAIKAVYREIMSGALALEQRPKVAYLGPPATFTHLASLEKFGSQVGYVDCKSITDVFAEVEKGRAHYGVVPIENSIEGAVTHTLDMFIDSDLKICSEVMLEISHNLLSRNDKLSEIKRVYSNPQVFGQCRLWLEVHLPTAELIEVSSTTRAAEIASREPHAAAIASDLAARNYKLKILYKSIEDNPRNFTRFLVIGRTQASPTGRDKTSIIFSIKDRVGALHDMLRPFKRHSINLTKIESRPSKRRAWEYYFFVDLEGHCQNKKVKAALSELEKMRTYLKVLGSYPVESA